MNTIINKTKLHMAASAFAIAAMVLSLVPMQAFAVQPENTGNGGGNQTPKIAICHATNSHTNPYNSANADETADAGGHDGHNGPVWFSGITTSWGDIIPPFTEGNVTYPGKNWTTEGQAILNNGCVVPTPVPTTGTLTVSKVISGITGIAANLFGYSINNAASIAFESDGSNSQTVNLGAYTVVESNVTAGQVVADGKTFNVSYSGCSGTLTTTPALCTITNTYVPPTVVNGCTDNTATNYVPTATPGNPDAANCTYTDVCPNITGNQATVPQGQVIVNGQCVQIVNGCTDSSALNYVPTATPGNPDAATCTYTDACPNLPNNQTTVPDGYIVVNKECVPIVNGCTNPDATNYNQAATPGNPQAAVCDMDYVSACLTTPANLLVNGSFEADQGLTNGNWGIFTSVLGWASANVNSDGLEIWRGLVTPSDGAQNAELDGNVPTTVSQTIVTIPGATYELRFDFAARANTGGASNNAVLATADATTLVSASTTNTNWTTYGSTFVADASTDISIADMGTPADSYGTLIDNAVLCLVREPAPVDYCPNIEGNQTADEGYLKDVKGQCYRPIDSCELSVVSDVTNLEDDAPALVVTAHPVWAQNIAGSLAQWIWGSAVDTPISPTVDETQTFTKTFVWTGTPATAILTIASDNGYSVKLNGTVVGGDAGEFNYSSTDTVVDLTDNLIQGVNTLEIAVTNKANGATSLNIENGNPAGLLYDLTITNSTGDCGDGGGEPDVLSCSITASDTSVRRGSDVTLNWSSVGASYVEITGLDDEELPLSGSELIENLGSDTTYTMTVYGEYNEREEVRDSETCSVTIDTTSGGGGGGTRVDNDPDGEVLGDSDSPKPLVLGEQTSVVPAGAPNTGKGGTAMTIIGQFLATPRRRNHA